MDYFPVFMDLRGRRCLVVGGGDAALRKTQLLLRAGAQVTVVAPELSAGLTQLASEDGNTRCVLQVRAYAERDLDAVVLVIAASEDAMIDRAVSVDAQARSIPVNVVDEPGLCSVILPALVDRSPIVIAIGTGGSAPILARNLRGVIESQLPARVGELASFAAAMRGEVRAQLPDVIARRRFWEAVFAGEVAELVLAGSPARAVRVLRSMLAAHGGAVVRTGAVSFVGIGPNDPELLSFRAQRLLQRADRVFAAPDVADDVVDLSRRDALRERLPAWPIPEPGELVPRLAAAVNRGQHVCVLAVGDAFRQEAGQTFVSQVDAAGLSTTIVPGIA
ncbi:MAG: NAD(P)-dependent oxidoreductase [Polyangiales bacterium]